MNKDINKEDILNEENQQQEELQNEEATNANLEEVGNDAVNEFEAKFNEANDKFLRLYSEFDNFRKRTAKEKIEIISTAGEGVIKELLPVVDDFKRAIESNRDLQDPNALKEGFELIFNKLYKTLEQKGLKRIESKGIEFNADIHEALTNIPAPSDDLKGKVVDVVEEGYQLGEKIIRYPKVVVGQ